MLFHFIKKIFYIFLQWLRKAKPESVLIYFEYCLHRELVFRGFSKNFREFIFLIFLTIGILFFILYPFFIAWDYIFPKDLDDWIDFWLNLNDFDKAVEIDQISYDTQLAQGILLYRSVVFGFFYWLIIQYEIKSKKKK